MSDPVMNQVQHYYIDWTFVWKIVLSVVSTLALIVGWFIRKWMNRWDKWKEDTDKEGGFVTRENHFKLCGESQKKCSGDVLCRVQGIEEWRDNMLDKGGPLTMKEHLVVCEKVIEKVTVDSVRRVNEGLNHQRELVMAEFGAMRALIQKDVLEAIQGLSRELKEHNGKNK